MTYRRQSGTLVQEGDPIAVLDLDGETIRVFAAAYSRGILYAGGRPLTFGYMETWARLEESELFRVAIGLGR